MSFETGTATSRGDLIAKWFNFLQANGWTADVDYAADPSSPAWGIIQRKVNLSPEDETTCNLHCGFVPFNGSDGFAAQGYCLNMIPMRDYVSGEPQDAVDVPTEGTTPFTTTSGNRHMVTLFPTAGPYERYWFFESDYYAHAVVETTVGFFRHFGMGQLSKIGRWFGGEYYYGSYPLNVANAKYTFNTIGLDPIYATTQGAPCVYGRKLNGDAFPGIFGRDSPPSHWYAMGTEGDVQDQRVRGQLTGNGCRGGTHAMLMKTHVSDFNGFRGMWPIFVAHWHTTPVPDQIYPLGFQPDVRSVSVAGAIEGGEEILSGADTWLVFPAHRKSATPIAGEWSGVFGLAYKKVTT